VIALASAVQIGVRVAFVAVALALWFWTQKKISQKALPPVGGGIGDRLHVLSAPLHGWLVANPRIADVTLILTSALIDLFGIYLLGAAVFGPTLRPFIAILLVFALRQVCQLTVTLPPPRGIIWRYPGFPSLLVTYGVSNDFFFSGHTAISVLAALQLVHTAPPWLAALGIAITALEAITVIVLRAHYTMDVFAAVFAAWGADVIATRMSPAIDAAIAHAF
jgi:hypothetical protein